MGKVIELPPVLRPEMLKALQGAGEYTNVVMVVDVGDKDDPRIFIDENVTSRDLSYYIQVLTTALHEIDKG